VEIIFFQVGFYGLIVRHFICYDTVSVLCILELILFFDVFLSRFGVEWGSW
jgi:hypothetical protein